MRILVAGWDSGGGVEAVQTVVQRAVGRGHHVRVLGTEGLRSRFESAGAGFRVYRHAPDNDLRRAETDLVKDWEARTPLGAFARVRDRVMFGPARQFCRDVVEELDREPADVVVVDTGPAVDPGMIRAPQNVAVRRWARHADVLPHCSAVITHGGHGTVIKALAAGVPLVVAPLGRDQPDIAARVVHAGAGLRVRKNASTAALQAAIGRVLDDECYRAGARRMAAVLAAERDDGLAVDELERVATRTRPAAHSPTDAPSHSKSDNRDEASHRGRHQPTSRTGD